MHRTSEMHEEGRVDISRVMQKNDYMAEEQNKGIDVGIENTFQY